MVARTISSPVRKSRPSLKNKDPLVGLEKEIDDVVSCCWSIISSNDENTTSRTNYNNKRNTIKNMEYNWKNESTVTLEKIAADISNVLGNLKEHLSAFKVRPDSFSDIEPQLEQMFVESTRITSAKTDTKNSKSQSQTKKQPVQQNKLQKMKVAANNNNSKDTKLLKSVTDKLQIKNYSSDQSSPLKQGSGVLKVKGQIQNPFVNNNNNNMKKSDNINAEKSKTKNNNITSQQDMNKNNQKINNNNNLNATNDASKNRFYKKQNSKGPSIPLKTNATEKEKSSQSNGNNKKIPSQTITNNNKTQQSKSTTLSAKSNTENSQKPLSQSKPPNQTGKASVNNTNSQKIVQQQKKAALAKNTAPSSQLKSASAKLFSQQSLLPTVNKSQERNLLKVNHVNISREVYDPLGILRDEVNRAIKEKKTFTIRGHYSAIRRALLRRGWIEKIHISYRDRIHEELKKYQTYKITELIELSRNKDIGEICKKLIKSKLLADHQVDLYWSFNTEAIKESSNKVKYTKFNKFRWDAFSYTSKQGLCQASKIAHWYQIPGVAKMNHPRTYSLVNGGDAEDFIKDFNRTAAMSLMKWVQSTNTSKLYKLLSPTGKIPLKVFDFGVNECYKIIKRATHEDIDSEIIEASELEWSEFLDNYYKIIHVGNHFKESEGIRDIDLVRKANFILDKLKEHWPYLEMDGMMNIWILKPTNSSQGWGIHMCRTLKYVLDVVKSNPKRRYIIQKYIERPLLIYNTKFDIRQWFLISKAVPLTIWIYKDCYLRFSSQTYNLRKLHESIHLTNNSVQCKYTKCTSRDLSLPSYNMWDSTHFISYLSDIGHPRAFIDIIYPGMKENITAAVLLHQDKIDQSHNCFELYGADFILTEDFKPWLLEINSNPALYASTPITARMCPAVLEDVVKVVIDYENNKKSSTGRFEMLYQGKITPVKCKELEQISAKILSPDFFYNNCSEQKLANNNNQKDQELQQNIEQKRESETTIPEATICIKEIGQGMRQTLVDLMELLKRERFRRENQMNKSIIAIFEKNSADTQTSNSDTVGPSVVDLSTSTMTNTSEELAICDIDGIISASSKVCDENMCDDVGSEQMKRKRKKSMITLLKKIRKFKE